MVLLLSGSTLALDSQWASSDKVKEPAIHGFEAVKAIGSIYMGVASIALLAATSPAQQGNRGAALQGLAGLVGLSASIWNVASTQGKVLAHKNEKTK